MKNIKYEYAVITLLETYKHALVPGSIMGLLSAARLCMKHNLEIKVLMANYLCCGKPVYMFRFSKKP